MANKFHAKKVWIVPGNAHMFRSEHDAKYYCEQHGIDFKTVEKYDSTKEYYRWLALQQDEKNGKITNLRRQVEYEIIPAKYEDQVVRYKSVKVYVVSTGHSSQWEFATKTQARKFCKERSIAYHHIETEERTVPVVKSVCIEKNAVYTADFVYDDADGKLVVEDTKSEYTRKEKDYVLRRKLMLHVHNIKILET